MGKKNEQTNSSVVESRVKKEDKKLTLEELNKKIEKILDHLGLRL